RYRSGENYRHSIPRYAAKLSLFLTRRSWSCSDGLIWRPTSCHDRVVASGPTRSAFNCRSWTLDGLIARVMCPRSPKILAVILHIRLVSGLASALTSGKLLLIVVNARALARTLDRTHARAPVRAGSPPAPTPGAAGRSPSWRPHRGWLHHHHCAGQ